MTRPRTGLGLLVTTLALTACGSGTHFANRARPTVPVNVSVYINDQRVSVSPPSVNPGPVAITFTNQSSSAQSLEVAQTGASSPVTTTGPISPQATDEVTVDLSSGSYSIAVASHDSTQATAAAPTGVVPALLTVQGQRGESNNQLLQP